MARRASEDTQDKIRNLRDCLQDRNKPCPGRRRAFADESAEDSIWPALGYRDPKSPFPVKAPIKPQPTTTWSVFGEADFDYERRTLTSGNLDLGLKTRTWTGMLGLDYSITNINNAYDGISFGVFGRDIGTRTTDNNGNTTRQTMPGVGGYFVYSNGWFSTDITGTASRSDLRSSAMTVDTPFSVYDLQINAQYKFRLNTTSWFEPTAGVIFTRTRFGDVGHIVGLQDSSSTRVQGGVRWGADYQWGDGTISPKITALLYEDVRIDEGNVLFQNILNADQSAGGALIPTDEGKVFGMLQGRLTADGGHGVSGFVEGEVRGRTGVLGLAARVGLTYAFASYP